MFNHVQVPSLPSLSSDTHLLSGLLTCPDFCSGFDMGQQAFAEDTENGEAPKTEDDLIGFVNYELSAQMYQRGKRIDQHFGFSSPSYVQHIGFVAGYLHQMVLTRQPA